MKSAAKLRLLPILSLIAFGTLLVPSAQAAPKVPSLQSTPQYKAFAKTVTKLQGLAGQQTTAAQKAAYDSELTSKHAAAVSKSTALFNRVKSAAKKETTARFKTGARKIRRAEAAEMADLKSEYDQKLDSAASAYEDDLDRVDNVYDRKLASLKVQIANLRVQKAKAKSLVKKAAIQDEIVKRIGRVAADKKSQKETVARVKADYRKQKEAILAAKAADTAEIEEDNDAALEKLRSRWNSVYNRQVGSAQSKRQTQLIDLEAKLNAGRAAIASMPIVG